MRASLTHAPRREIERAPNRCACGAVMGPTGECEACRARRLAAERASAERRQDTTPVATGSRHDFGSIGVENQSGERGPSGPANRFDDCPRDWQTKANAAAQTGAGWVANAITGLSNLPTPIPAPVTTLLNRHFHTTYDRDIRRIVGQYMRISAAINSAIDFECETECDGNTRAYVYEVWSDIHLCPPWFNSGNSGDQAKTVVHEIAHDAAGRDDKAYYWERSKYNRLSVDEAIDNADSYAVFAREAYGA